jgi:hypothetical protein
MRLLILACSATKRHDAGLLPAIERYDGPNYRTLRRFVADHPAGCEALDVFILSGELGLLRGHTAIPDYDRRMDTRRVLALRLSVADVLSSHLEDRRYDATFVGLGRDYAPALEITSDLRPHLGTLTVATGGIGTRLGQLRRWLIAGT